MSENICPLPSQIPGLLAQPSTLFSAESRVQALKSQLSTITQSWTFKWAQQETWEHVKRGSSFEGTTWSKGISFFHRMQIFFQVFIQYATYHPYNAKVFKTPFHPFFAIFFSIFHCQMLHNVHKNYKMDELLCIFYKICIEQLGQGEYKSSLLREVVTPLSSWDN